MSQPHSRRDRIGSIILPFMPIYSGDQIIELVERADGADGG